MTPEEIRQAKIDALADKILEACVGETFDFTKAALIQVRDYMIRLEATIIT